MTATSTRETTDVQATMAMLLRRHGGPELGRKLGVTPRTVQRWAKGERKPSAGDVERIVAMASAPATSPAPAAPPACSARASAAPRQDLVAPAPPGASGERLDARAEAEATVRALRGELVRLDLDPLATSRERASLSTALTSAIRLLSRLDGSLEVTPQMVLRSATWRQIVEVLSRALVPWPGAARAAGEALTKLGNPKEGA